MKLLRAFVSSYPWQSLLMVILLLIAGIADGFGLSAMLPMLNLAFDSTSTSEPPNDVVRVINETIESVGLEPSIGVLLCIIFGGVGLKSLLVFIAQQRVGYIAADIATELRIRLLRAITATRWQFYVNQSTGRLANSMATEAWRASSAYVHAIQLLVVLVETVVYATVALLVSWQATLICLVASMAVLALSHYFVRVSQQAGSGQTLWYRSLLGSLTDILQSVKTFKAMGREKVAETLVARETRALRGELRHEVLGNAGLEAAQEPLYTLVIVVGVYVALVQFSMEVATVTFLTLVLARLLKRGSKVQKWYQRMVTCETAYWALEDTIADARRQAETDTGERPPVFERSIRLENVSFAYGDAPVLDGVSMEIPFGDITCLIGESGTGKSTVADLVLALIPPATGCVLVDDVPLEEIDRRAWRRTIGYVPQENLLLHDTVANNVALADTDLTDVDIEAALEAAGAMDFVGDMPMGIHSVVGERGARLSGGQRQRIMIARALVRRPKLLVLDEATSALDPASEAAIGETLASLKGRVTILAVSHQSSLKRLADHVYLLTGHHIAPQATVPRAQNA